MERPINVSSIPPSLTFYRGGLNVGVFQPGPPVYSEGSVVFGNLFEGQSYEYRTQSIDPGEKSFGWVLIVSSKDSNILIKSYGENRSVGVFSEYDGLYNRSLLNTSGRSAINAYKKGNYTDWYIPSRDELAFICKNLPMNFSLDFRFEPMRRRYISSTYVKNSTRKQNFLYAQLFNSDTYGVTSFVEDKKQVPVRYVRRVPVTII